MKKIIGLLGFLWIISANCQILSKIDLDRLANAINWAENSPKYPYGIRSIKVKNEAEARTICLNSIRNAHERWKAAGKPGSFISFLGSRYAPISSHKLNLNWVKNVSYFYAAQTFE